MSQKNILGVSSRVLVSHLSGLQLSRAIHFVLAHRKGEGNPKIGWSIPAQIYSEIYLTCSESRCAAGRICNYTRIFTVVGWNTSRRVAGSSDFHRSSRITPTASEFTFVRSTYINGKSSFVTFTFSTTFGNSKYFTFSYVYVSMRAEIASTTEFMLMRGRSAETRCCTYIRYTK